MTAKKSNRQYKKIAIACLSVSLVSSALAMSGCAKKEHREAKDIIAYVNKEPIYGSDLDRELELRARQDPNFARSAETEKEQLDMMINKTLIIQDAMRKGLARSESFVNTIRKFWEQTLIRDFIYEKRKDFKDRLFAAEDEVKKYYGRLSDRLTFRVLKSAEKAKIDEAYSRFIKSEDAFTVLNFETIGPVSYDDIISPGLAEAFDMAPGEASRFEEGPYYYLVIVATKDKVEIAGLDDLRADIKNRIIAAKERKLFDEWLREKRAKAKIKVLKR